MMHSQVLLIIFLSTGGILNGIVENLTTWIADYGYPAVFVAGLFFLTPTEIIFPIVGYSVSTHKLGLENAIGMGAVGGVGATIGAIILYYIGFKLGVTAILKLERYLRIGKSDLEKSEKWFKKYGSMTVFACRMVPGIREFISIPAGIAKMNLVKFIIYTLFGSIIWCISWTLVGFYFADSWKTISEQLSSSLDIVAIIIVVSLIGVFVYRRFRNH